MALNSNQTLSVFGFQNVSKSGGGGGGGFFPSSVSTADSVQDFSKFNMNWLNVGDFYAEATTLPSLGQASFEWLGCGTTNSFITQRFSSNSGTIHEWYGDKSQKVYGDINFDFGKSAVFNGSLAYISKSTGSNGLSLNGNGGAFIVGWNSGQVLHTGNLDIDSIFTINSNSSSYYTQASGNYAWRFGKTGNNGAIKGNITNSFNNVELVTFIQDDGSTLFNIPSVAIGASSVNVSAILQLDSTSKGFLPPRMTKAQRDAIPSPSEGLLIYQTDNTNGWYGYKDNAWAIIA